MMKTILRIFLSVISFTFVFPVFSQNPEWTVYNTSNSGLPENRVTSITIDESRNKCIGTGNFWGGSRGLAKFDDANWKVY